METSIVSSDDSEVIWVPNHKDILKPVSLFLMLVGIIGNLIVCIVIARSKSMHTVTNCYLFNLSISDLIFVTQGTVFELTTLIPDTIVYIVSINTAVEELILYSAIIVSTMTVIAFTIERYLAICHPFLAMKKANVRRTVKLLVVFWVMSFMFMVPRYLFIFFDGIDEDVRKFVFRINQYINDAGMYMFYVVPMIIIVTLYLLIGLKLRERSKMSSTNSLSINLHATQKTNLKIIGVIVAVTFVCWTPKFAIYLTFRVASRSTIEKHFLSIANFRFARDLATTLFFVSPILNPIIYSAMSSKFREAFKEVMVGCCTRVSDAKSDQDTV